MRFIALWEKWTKNGIHCRIKLHSLVQSIGIHYIPVPFLFFFVFSIYEECARCFSQMNSHPLPRCSRIPRRACSWWCIFNNMQISICWFSLLKLQAKCEKCIKIVHLVVNGNGLISTQKNEFNRFIWLIRKFSIIELYAHECS